MISNVTPLTPALTVTAPNGGELWEAGATRNMTWTNVSFSDPVKIEYSPDGGANWTVLASNVPNTGTYTWTINASSTTQGRMRVSDAVDGNPSDVSDNNFTMSNADGSRPVAVKLTLLQNYPNPSNPTTNISFSLPDEARITLKVYNLLGEEVATLVDGERNAGYHTVVFEAKNLPSGVYFAVLQADEVKSVQRLLLVK